MRTKTNGIDTVATTRLTSTVSRFVTKNSTTNTTSAISAISRVIRIQSLAPGVLP